MNLSADEDRMRLLITSLDLPLPVNFLLQSSGYSSMRWAPIFVGGLFTLLNISSRH